MDPASAGFFIVSDDYKADEADFEGFLLAKATNRAAGKPVVRWSTIYKILIPWWQEYTLDELGIQTVDPEGNPLYWRDGDTLEDDYSEESFP